MPRAEPAKAARPRPVGGQSHRRQVATVKTSLEARAAAWVAKLAAGLRPLELPRELAQVEKGKKVVVA